MKIKVSADDLIDKGVWDKVCDLKGLNPWCVNEGTMDSNDDITFTEDEAKKLGLIK